MSSGLIDRCVIVDNVAKYSGDIQGAVRISGGTLRNSLVARNRTTGSGTGVTLSGGTVENCTIVGNSCYSGTDATATGLYQTGGTVVNAIIWGNTALDGSVANVKKTSGSLTYSCMTPKVDATGNVDGVPKFADAASGDYRLEYCAAADAGTPLSWHEGATDLSLVRARVLGDAVDMGCYESEPVSFACSFELNALSGFAPLAMTATATVVGDATGVVYRWYVNGGAQPDFEGTDCASVSWNYSAGLKTVRLEVENASHQTATSTISGISVSPKVAYVDCTNTSGSARPYDGEGNAGTNLEEVLAACLPGVEVRVKPGTYTLGAVVNLAGGTKLVATGGPLVTTLTCPDKAMDLLDVRDAGTVLSGFSLTMPKIYMLNCCLTVGTGGVVTNCIVRDLGADHDNMKTITVSGGTMVDCLVTNIVIAPKFTYLSRTGVKLSSGLVDRCVIVDNSTGDQEGAVQVSGGVLRNSLVARNRSPKNGTGVTVSGSGRVENCTVVSNSCNSGTDATATGLHQTGGTVVNTVVWGNTALDGSVANVGKTGGSLTYSCMTPLADGSGNTEADPLFRDAANGNYTLMSASPCLRTGSAAGYTGGSADCDLAGKPRFYGTRIDMGAYGRPKGGLSLIIR